jgi:hypothetical protein
MLCHQRYSTESFHLHQSRINSTNSQPPMKNNTVHQSFVCHTVPSRLSRTNRSFPILAFIALFAGCLLSGNVAHAQVNQLKFDFEDAPGTTTASDTSLGGVAVTLGMQTNNGTAFDGHGAAGSGVLGAVNGKRALNFSMAAKQGGAGPVACTTNAALGFGNVTNFVVTMWMKQSVGLANTTGGRMFVLGNSTNLDATANSISMKWQDAADLYFYVNTVQATAAFGSNLPTNKWIFVAMAYDGTNVTLYEGTETTSATLVGTKATAGQIVLWKHSFLVPGQSPGPRP